MAEGAGKVPVIECVREAWTFLARHWRLFAPAAAIVALLSQAGRLLAFMAPPQGDQSMLSQVMGNLLIVAPILIASVLFSAAVLRKYLRDEVSGPVGLTFGADEVRLIGLAAAFACIFGPFALLFFLVMTTVVLARVAQTPEQMEILLNDPEALANALGPSGAMAFSLLTILAMVIFIYVMTRLFLVQAATIGERRIVMFQTWRWTRGNLFRVFSAFMLTWLPAYLINSILGELIVAIVTPLASGGGAVIVLLAANVAIAFIGLLASVPQIVLGAILYKGLRPPDFVAK